MISKVRIKVPHGILGLDLFLAGMLCAQRDEWLDKARQVDSSTARAERVKIARERHRNMIRVVQRARRGPLLAEPRA